MQFQKNIVTFSTLGNYLLDEANIDTINHLCITARNENAWFTEDNVRLALENIARYFLSENLLKNFLAQYPNNIPAKKVGIVMAGNIPAVGFHDLLCTVLSGNIALVKLSSSDSAVMRFLIRKLYELDENLQNSIQLIERLNDAEALIATGSDNTAKHFDYYFANKPRIIRKNRTSIAILNGSETRTDLANLGNDLFTYFGLGCRNVSKIFVPKDYEFSKFYESIEYWSTIQIHHKYNNNYDYNKSIYLINGSKHLDNGFLLLKEDKGLVSPISTCFYETYNDEHHLEQLIAEQNEKIQCIVSKDRFFENSFNFGEAQTPKLDDFADGVNTMQFLKNL